MVYPPHEGGRALARARRVADAALSRSTDAVPAKRFYISVGMLNAEGLVHHGGDEERVHAARHGHRSMSPGRGECSTDGNLQQKRDV